jgi:uncharacterized protein (DUF58 family)
MAVDPQEQAVDPAGAGCDAQRISAVVAAAVAAAAAAWLLWLLLCLLLVAAALRLRVHRVVSGATCRKAISEAA